MAEEKSPVQMIMEARPEMMKNYLTYLDSLPRRGAGAYSQGEEGGRNERRDARRRADRYAHRRLWGDIADNPADPQGRLIRSFATATATSRETADQIKSTPRNRKAERPRTSPRNPREIMA